MIFTALHEGFFTQIKVGFFTALCITFPIISMQLWKFIAPGLYKNERKAFLPFLIATPVLFTLGAAMEYLSLMMRLIFAFGLAFELPVILLLLARAGLVTHQGLAEKRKIAIVISFVVAAILTPPDVISQLLLAVPIILLYELSIYGARLMSPPENNEFDNS